MLFSGRIGDFSTADFSIETPAPADSYNHWGSRKESRPAVSPLTGKVMDYQFF